MNYTPFLISIIIIVLPFVVTLQRIAQFLQRLGQREQPRRRQPVAQLEEANVTFQDSQEHERADVAMLDPGTSAFLCGFGPDRRYLMFLESEGFPIEKINLFCCHHKFHFGDDGESCCHWVMEMPMHISGACGTLRCSSWRARCYVVGWSSSRLVWWWTSGNALFDCTLVHGEMPPLDFTLNVFSHPGSLSSLWIFRGPWTWNLTSGRQRVRLTPWPSPWLTSRRRSPLLPWWATPQLMDFTRACRVSAAPMSQRFCVDLLQSESLEYHAYVTEELHEPVRRKDLGSLCWTWKCLLHSWKVGCWDWSILFPNSAPAVFEDAYTKGNCCANDQACHVLELQRKCDGTHQHCPLEGSASGVGLRTTTSLDLLVWSLRPWRLIFKQLSESLNLLGASENCRMPVFKPCYGQLDACRRWYLAATRRLTELKLSLVCSTLAPSRTPSRQFLIRSLVLDGMICIPVDDVLGAGSETSEVNQHFLATLKDAFSFHWKPGTELEYCRATINRTDHVPKHGQYLQRINPVTLAKHVGPEKNLSSLEVTALRGWMGSLSCPAVQTSPHLQARISMLAGDVFQGLASQSFQSQQVVRSSKEQLLVFVWLLRHLGRWETGSQPSMLLCCSRADGNSQGGFFVLLAPKRDFGKWWWCSPYPWLEELQVIKGCEKFFGCNLHCDRASMSLLWGLAEAPTEAFWAPADSCHVAAFSTCSPTPNWSLQPTMMTDVKSVYGLWHRESMSSVDKRSGLEIRVVKEQLQSLGWQLRWVSSERLADGLTKMSTRQGLADRLCGKVEFLHDPASLQPKRNHFQIDKPKAILDQNLFPLPWC